MYEYTSLLRINEANLEDLWEKLRKYEGCFDEIAIFSQHTHSVKNLDEHRETAQRMEAALRKAQKLGIRAGINVLTTVGFFPECLDPKLSKMQKTVNMDGSINEGRLCSCNQDNREYMKELYRIYAGISPDFIYIDDDISGLSCFCPQCIQRFEEQYHVFGERTVTREHLLELFSSDDLKIRQHVREAWMSFNALRIGEVFELIEQTVHSVDTAITLGAMTYMTGTDGLDTDNWARKLKGNTAEIRWRPGGGVYHDYNPISVIEKANRMSAQIRYLPAFAAKVDSEIENFPYQSLKKTPSFTAFESLIYLAAGCTGTAFNICAKEEQIGEEHDEFFKMALEVKKAGKLLTETFGREDFSGAGFWWDKKTVAYQEEQDWDMNKSVPFTNDIHEMGIPMAYNEKMVSIYFLNKTAAMQMTDEELKNCLSKGVLMDCEALDICNKRGFGALTGFQVKEVYESDTMEQELEHWLNLPGCHRRNPRQAFGYCGATYTIEKVNDSAEYLAENRDLKDNLRGMSSGIFENELGGRVCIEGITPFSWYCSLPRNVHLKNVCRWLSKDMLTAYLKSFHRIVLWVRGGAVFLANMATEEARKAEIMIKTDSNRMEVTVMKGGRIIATEKMEAVSEENGYRLFSLPEIPVLGTALIKP